MANVVRDPKVHPDAILPDLSKPDPLVKFTKDDIAFVYGSKWKQRYFTKKGDDYYPLGAQWDVTHQIWRPYMVAPNTDWWSILPHREHAATDRTALRRLPFGQLQHPNQVRHRVERRLRKVPRPWSGARSPTFATNIVNPARLDTVQATNVCIQCHSQGQPLSNPIDGKYYDWPVGFTSGWT